MRRKQNDGCFLCRRCKTHNSNFLRKRVVMRNLYGNAPVQNVAFPDTICIESHVK